MFTVATVSLSHAHRLTRPAPELAGREWASNIAEHRDLAALADISSQLDVTLDVVSEVLDPEKNMDAKELVEYLGLSEVRENELDEYIEPFVDGAVEVFHEVEAQL